MFEGCKLLDSMSRGASADSRSAIRLGGWSLIAAAVGFIAVFSDLAAFEIHIDAAGAAINVDGECRA